MVRPFILFLLSASLFTGCGNDIDGQWDVIVDNLRVMTLVLSEHTDRDIDGDVDMDEADYTLVGHRVGDKIHLERETIGDPATAPVWEFDGTVEEHNPDTIRGALTVTIKNYDRVSATFKRTSRSVHHR